MTRSDTPGTRRLCEELADATGADHQRLRKLTDVGGQPSCDRRSTWPVAFKGVGEDVAVYEAKGT